MRGATKFNVVKFVTAEFQLTRPMRGATNVVKIQGDCIKISTHTPHAGRDRAERGLKWKKAISTHTPHAGRDGGYFYG